RAPPRRAAPGSAPSIHLPAPERARVSRGGEHGTGASRKRLTSDVLLGIGRSGVEWVACYESAIEGDARTVLAMLEGRGIPCRLAPLGSSVYPQMGFAVLVPTDGLEAARELIESEAPDEPAEASEPDDEL